MAKKSKSSADATASLDSFLDTLFNVAGILVIIIALAQITARETIKDVNTGKKSHGGITEEQLAQIQEKLAQAKRERDGQKRIYNNYQSQVALKGTQVTKQNNELEKQKRTLNLEGEFIPTSELDALLAAARNDAIDRNATWIQLANTYTNIRALKDKQFILARLKKVENAADDNRTALMALQQSKQKLDQQHGQVRTNLIVIRGVKTQNAQEARLRVREKERDQLKRDMADKQETLDDLEKSIVQRELLAALGKMNIPIPREIPKGKKHYGLMCRYNRIIADKHADQLFFGWKDKYDLWLRANDRAVNAERFNKVISRSKAINNLLKKEWAGLNPALEGPILKGRFFNVDCTHFPAGASIKWANRQVGDTTAEIWAKNSALRKQLQQLTDGGEHYIQFYVYADSFEVYLAARKIADSLNLQSGWKPFENHGVLSWGGEGVVD